MAEASGHDHGNRLVPGRQLGSGRLSANPYHHTWPAYRSSNSVSDWCRELEGDCALEPDRVRPDDSEQSLLSPLYTGLLQAAGQPSWSQDSICWC